MVDRAVKVAKTIRILTVAPLMALVMLVILQFREPSVLGGIRFFLLLSLFLTVFPLLAYPLQPVVPYFKHRGREGQRTLAMIFAVAGYIIGCFSALLLHGPRSIALICIAYLLSGILVVLFNKVFHRRASGHACGITGPFALLLYFRDPLGFLGVLVLGAAWWASRKMERHTGGQLAGGTLIPIAALCVTALLCVIS